MDERDDRMILAILVGVGAGLLLGLVLRSLT